MEKPPNFVKPQIWVKYVIFTSFLPSSSKIKTNLGVLCQFDKKLSDLHQTSENDLIKRTAVKYSDEI